MKVALSLAVFMVASAILDRVAEIFLPEPQSIQVAHTPNYREQRTSLEFSYEFRTNSMGLRYAEIPLEKTAKSEYRVVVVGDSFTEGFGVAESERFSARLEETFSLPNRPAYFINCGLSAQGPLEYGFVLLTVGTRYRPDLALIVLYPNDLRDTRINARLQLVRSADGGFTLPPSSLSESSHGFQNGLAKQTAYRIWPWSCARVHTISRNIERKRIDALSFMELVEKQAASTGISVDELNAWKERTPKNLLNAAEKGQFDGALLALGLFSRNILRQCLDVEGPFAQAKLSSMQRILTQIVVHCREIDLDCAVVYAPCEVQYDPAGDTVYRAIGVHVRDEWLTEKCELERRLQNWAENSQVAFLSLTPAFRTACAECPGFYNFEYDSHWNPKGHELAAETIAEWLRDGRFEIAR